MAMLPKQIFSHLREKTWRTLWQCQQRSNLHRKLTAVPFLTNSRQSSSDQSSSSSPPKQKRESYLSFINKNVKLLSEEMWTKLKSPNLDTMFDQNRVLWHFDGPDTIKDFIVHSDAEIGGKSSAGVTMSRNNKLLFHGNLCTELPRDGETKRSGYCALRTKQSYVSILYIIELNTTK